MLANFTTVTQIRLAQTKYRFCYANFVLRLVRRFFVKLIVNFAPIFRIMPRLFVSHNCLARDISPTWEQQVRGNFTAFSSEAKIREFRRISTKFTRYFRTVLWLIFCSKQIIHQKQAPTDEWSLPRVFWRLLVNGDGNKRKWIWSHSSPGPGSSANPGFNTRVIYSVAIVSDNTWKLHCYKFYSSRNWNFNPWLLKPFHKLFWGITLFYHNCRVSD